MKVFVAGDAASQRVPVDMNSQRRDGAFAARRLELAERQGQLDLGVARRAGRHHLERLPEHRPAQLEQFRVALTDCQLVDVRIRRDGVE